MNKNESNAIADVREALLEVTNMRHDYEPAWFRDAIEIRYALIDPILWSLGWHTWLPEECRPDLLMDHRGRIDYGLIDYDGELDIMIHISTRWAQSRFDRARLAKSVAGITIGVAVLTDGLHWEIYDLSKRSRRLEDKMVASLEIDPDKPEKAETDAETLYGWIGKDRAEGQTTNALNK